MAVVPLEVDTVAAAPSTGRPRRGRWMGHLLAYLLLLVALLAMSDLHHGWNLDDGAYATQVRVIEQTGGWAYPYRHRAIDPESRYAPVSHATTTTTGAYPYAKLPAWIEVLRASSRVFGQPVGLYVPAVAGALVAALMGGLLADRLVPGRGALGFWAVGLGPILIHTQAVWAHTAAAALGGAACLGILAVAERRARWWHLLGLVSAAAALAAVRNEGTLFALSLAIVLGGLHLARSGALRVRVRSAVVWGAPCVVVALAVRWLVGRWSAAVAPGAAIAITESQPGGSGFVAGRLTGAARTLLDGVGGSGAGTAFAVLTVLLAIAGGTLLRRGGARRNDGLVLLGLALALAIARTVVVAPDDLAGFLLAAPVVAMGAGAWRWRSASTGERALVAVVVGHTLAVLATQYPEGGSRDWGGRFLFPVLVPALVVAALTLHRLMAARPGGRGTDPSVLVDASVGGAGRTLGVRARVATAAVLLACALPTAGGLGATHRALDANRDLDRLSRRVAQQVPTIIKVPRYLTRTGWASLPGADWLSADPGTAQGALAMLRPGRTTPVAVVGNGADQVRAPGYRRDVRSPVVVIFTPT